MRHLSYWEAGFSCTIDTSFELLHSYISSLTTSFVASALGAWVLFGPAAAATWGGIGAVIGYALGTAFPMIFLIYLGKKIRKESPKGSSLIEFMRNKKEFKNFVLTEFLKNNSNPLVNELSKMEEKQFKFKKKVRR